MNRYKGIVVFGGTIEGRLVSEALSKKCIYHTLCVATNYGEELIPPGEYVYISTGRKDTEAMKLLFVQQGTQLAIDCTHPYAKFVSENIKEACKALGVSLWRYERDRDLPGDITGDGDVEIFESAEDCACYLNGIKGNILLTTGSKTLSVFAGRVDAKRIFVRVIPSKESLDICEECKIPRENIMAMQGPFSLNMNTALIRQWNIKTLVTKNSGRAGGVSEKLEAAKQAGIRVCVIK